MLISRIDTTNQPLFDALLPEEWSRKLTLPSIFALGAIVDEDENDPQPAGVLVFSVQEGTDGPALLIAATIEWFFVSPAYRGGQAADALMNAFWDIMDQSGIEHILCDVPMPSEYDRLCAYLESWDFQFTLVDRYELTIPLRDISAIPALHQPPRAVIQPLSQADPKAFQRFLAAALDQPGAPLDLPQSPAAYDMQSSCFYATSSDIDGALLVQQISSELLEIRLLRSLSASQHILSDLCRFAAQQAAKQYPADMQVRIVCRLESVGRLIDKLFPGAQPLLVRRGYYDNTPENAASSEEESSDAAPDSNASSGDTL